MQKATITNVIFRSTGDDYEPVTNVCDLSTTYKMIANEIPWSGEAFYYMVEGEKGGYYPLPLIYASEEKRQANATAYGKECPSEDWVKDTRRKVSAIMLSTGMVYYPRSKWVVGPECRRQISDLYDRIKTSGFNWNDYDRVINRVLLKKGTEFLFDIVESYGFSLFFGNPQFGITFGEEDLVGWNEYDRSSYEAVVYKFAAYCCAKRAEETKADVGVSEYSAVEDFIDELRARLAQVEEACENS